MNIYMSLYIYIYTHTPYIHKMNEIMVNMNMSIRKKKKKEKKKCIYIYTDMCIYMYETNYGANTCLKKFSKNTTVPPLGKSQKPATTAEILEI